MIIRNLADRLDSLDNKGTAKLIAVLLVFGLASEFFETSLTTFATASISCLCKSLLGDNFTLELITDIQNNIECGEGDYDHCTCENSSGELVDLNLEHLNWISEFDKLELDLTCQEGSIRKRNKRSTSDNDDAETTVETKSNVVSRTIKGAGSIVDGIGDVANNSVSAVGNVASGIISGGIHLVGTATKAVTGVASGTLNAVGSVFEGSKTKTKTRNRRSATKERVEVTSIEKVDGPDNKPRITTTDEKDAWVSNMDNMVRDISRITQIINAHNTVSGAKKALLDAADSERDDDMKSLFISIADILRPEDVDHQIDEIDVVKSISETTTNNTVIDRVKAIKGHLEESDDVTSFYTRMKDDKSATDLERNFVDHLGKGLKSQYACGRLDQSIKINPFTSIEDVIKSLKSRPTICGDNDDILVQSIRALEAIPKMRKRRNVDAAKKPKKVVKKVAKPKKKLVKKVTSNDEAAKKPSSTEEVAEHPHQEEEHEEEEVVEEVEAEEHICQCDPDTCKPL